MSFELSPVNVNSALGSSIDKLNNHTAQNSIVSGGDFHVKKNMGGTTIRLKQRYKNQFEGVNYKGEWDPNAGYSVNDAVRVLPFINYIDEDTDEVIDASVGVWVCVARVPDKAFSDNFIGDSTHIKKHIRQPNVDYFPKKPEPESIATVDEPTGRYWEQIGVLEGLQYRGTWDSGSAYSAGDIVRMQTGNIKGTWIAVGSGSITTPPEWPEPATAETGVNKWELLAPGIQTFLQCAGTSKTIYIGAMYP